MDFSCTKDFKYVNMFYIFQYLIININNGIDEIRGLKLYIYIYIVIIILMIEYIYLIYIKEFLINDIFMLIYIYI